MTERLLSTTVDLPEKAPEDPDRYSVFLYFHRDGNQFSGTERVDDEYVAVDGRRLRVVEYPVDATRVFLRLKVSWLDGHVLDGLDDAEFAVP